MQIYRLRHSPCVCVCCVDIEQLMNICELIEPHFNSKQMICQPTSRIKHTLTHVRTHQQHCMHPDLYGYLYRQMDFDDFVCLFISHLHSHLRCVLYHLFECEMANMQIKLTFHRKMTANNERQTCMQIIVAQSGHICQWPICANGHCRCQFIWTKPCFAYKFDHLLPDKKCLLCKYF